ncbi:MAG: DUF2141 domain-containing protein, partial [Acidobacteria bacterium]|nr:DUF2141 domain-containing protein [Acidobacteriota bacterium]
MDRGERRMMSGRSKVARRFMLVAGVFAPLVLSSASPLFAASGVAVTINKVRPGKGRVHIALVNKAQFLLRKKLKTPLKKGIVKSLGESVQFTFKDVAPGDYAVQVLQDFDGDGFMTYNWLGLPKEPWGISNNPPIRFGPPKWERSKFSDSVNSELGKVRLREIL